ncbi:MAG: ABC transporter substrate-binding protein [Oscillospiraceae bacterium]
MKRALCVRPARSAAALRLHARPGEHRARPGCREPLTLCLGAEPATLDPARTENGVGATYVVNLFSGLTGYRAGGDGSRELTPELCAELPVPESLPDGRVQYVFTLRDGLTWSDGTPLTAADFVYAWNRACTLEDAAAPYLFACIDGYGTGRLNVTASPDGRTLTVVLAEAMPTFLQLCAQPAYAPVPSGAADTMRRTADGAGFAVSGPYTVAAWTDEGLTYVKNPAYWDADNVTAETVRFAFEPDPDAAGACLSCARLCAQSGRCSDAALDDLRTNHAPELRTVSRLAHLQPLLSHERSGAERLYAAGARADPHGACAAHRPRRPLRADHTRCAAERERPHPVRHLGCRRQRLHRAQRRRRQGRRATTAADYAANCQQAVALLRQAASRPAGFTVNAQGVCAGFPELTYLTSDAAGHVAIADDLQALYARYGISLTVTAQDMETFLTSRAAGGYSVTRCSFSADIDDPMPFSSSGRAAQAATSSPSAAARTRTTRATASRSTAARRTTVPGRSHTTRCSTASQSSGDTAERYALMHQAETLLMQTGAVCPLYWYTDTYLCNTHVQGLLSGPLGAQYLMAAHVQK